MRRYSRWPGGEERPARPAAYWLQKRNRTALANGEEDQADWQRGIRRRNGGIVSGKREWPFLKYRTRSPENPRQRVVPHRRRRRCRRLAPIFRWFLVDAVSRNPRDAESGDSPPR